MNPIEEALRSASTIAQAAVQSGVDIGRREREAEVCTLLLQLEELDRLVGILCDALEQVSLVQTAGATRARLAALQLERQA